MDIRKIAIIFVIGALFAILAFSTIDAFVENPRDEFCSEKFFDPPRKITDEIDCDNIIAPREAQIACNDNDGYIIYDYDENGCAVDYQCSCKEGYSDALRNYEFLNFILYTIFATIGIAIGVFLPSKKNPLHEWVGTGFMVGGFICLFIGTIRYFEEMNKMIRPVVILIEMVIIIYISYKKLGDIKEQVKK